VDFAVLHPMTRGIMPDRHLGTAIASAHNEILVTRWLDHDEFGERFRGTIRVNPDDIAGSLREIDKYKSHPGVVQIGVPLQSRELFGKPQFWPLWEAAVEANLPVAAHIEVGSGIAAAPTPSGNTLTYEQYLSFMSLNYLYHLMNMIAEGVFERMPSLKFVWADGAADMLTPFIWRMDCFGRPHLEQTPWAPRMPSDYLPGHVYFVQGSFDGPGDTEFAGEWFGFTGKENMVMFGSSYPHWHSSEPRVPAAYSADQRDKYCWRNAAELYGIDIPAGLVAQ
jgi:predicted TIM-barrel fold metal-dependent hydrolase